MIGTEILGYLAAAVTLATYSTKTMIPLRIFGIASQVLFFAYGYFLNDYPSMVLYAILIPINGVRLFQMVQLLRQVREAGESDLDMGWLRPFMSSRKVESGETLFHKGDDANEMFLVVSGRCRLVETGMDIGPGNIVGEFGLLTPDRARTQTLQCIEGGKVLHIRYDRVKELYFQNPRFGFYLLQLTSRRLFENITKLEAELASRPSIKAATGA